MNKSEAKRIALATLEVPSLTCCPSQMVLTWREKFWRFLNAIRTWIINLRSLHVRWAYNTIARSIRNDPSYARVWHANIAMPIYDASHGRVNHTEACRLATVIMKHFFGADVD